MLFCCFWVWGFWGLGVFGVLGVLGVLWGLGVLGVLFCFPPPPFLFSPFFLFLVSWGLGAPTRGRHLGDVEVNVPLHEWKGPED